GGEEMQSLANDVAPVSVVDNTAGSIEVDNVGHVYESRDGKLAALSAISFKVEPHRFVVIVGPSGCGKSSLLMMMAGLRRPTSGDILCQGAPIAAPDPSRVAVVFQEASLFPWLTAEENVEFPLSLRATAKVER